MVGSVSLQPQAEITKTSKNRNLTMSNSEFGIQSWMMIKMKKRSKYCECNKVKEQREDKR